MNVFRQWNDAAKALAEFKTHSLAELTQAKQAAVLELNVERSRVRVARAQHKAYTTENLQKLNSDFAALQSAETRLREVRLLSITPPENSDDARLALDQAFASVGEAYAAIPERLRARISPPSPNDPNEMPENIQRAFWEELKSRSIPVLLIVAFALMLDLLPPMVLFATAPKPAMPERILGIRRRVREVKNALRVPLAPDIESVKITVEEAPALDIRIKVPTSHGGPVLDINRDFADVTEEICRETAREMVLSAVRSASGKPLVDGSPLLAQLGGDREVVLSYAPKIDPGFEACSSEVN